MDYIELALNDSFNLSIYPFILFSIYEVSRWEGRGQRRERRKGGEGGEMGGDGGEGEKK